MRFDRERATAYIRRDFRADLIAGLTIAVMGIPQAMGYALIAGLPPVYGLYTAIVCCLVAALTGSSSHLVTGPTNAISMVLFSLTAPYIKDPNHLEIIFLLTLMTGLAQVAMGLLKMGGVMRYVSNSVVVGFTAGAAILIAGNQVSNVLGISLRPEDAERFYRLVAVTVSKITGANLYTIITGATAIAIMIICRKVSRRMPAALVSVLFASALVYFTGWHDSQGVSIVRDISATPIRRSLDIFHLPHFFLHPDFALIKNLSGGAIALAILGLVEAASISRAVAASSGQRIDFSREFLSQGVSNTVGAFFSNFAGSGSFTRTAVCYQAGGRTRMAPALSAVWTALTLLLFAPLANYIPKAALGGMLIVIAWSLVEKHRMALAWRAGSNSRVVLFGTLAATLILPLEYAIFVGIFLSIFFLLKITGKADLTQLVPRPDGGFDEIPFNRAAPAPIVIVNMEGDLYFAAVEDLDYELQQVLTPETRVVVLRMKRLRAVGSTAMAILEHFWGKLHDRGISLVVCGIEHDLLDVMTRSGLRRRIGEPNIFFADNKIFQSTELAVARAVSIVKMEQARQGSAPVPSHATREFLHFSARDFMSRNCIRFGDEHHIREAVWLLSEMHRRMELLDPQTLYLQNREGKLSASLTVWQLLDVMIGERSVAELEALDDGRSGAQMSLRFNESIETISRKNPPSCQAGMPLFEVARTMVATKEPVLPVCDPGGRVIGLINQADLLGALGKALGAGFPAGEPENAVANEG